MHGLNIRLLRFHLLAVPPPVTDGLVGWFTGASFLSSSVDGYWLDLSGAGNHATVSGFVRSRVETNASRANWLNGHPHVYSAWGYNNLAKITFPAAMTPNVHTIFSLTKYNGAAAKKGTLLCSANSNGWLSGHLNSLNTRLANRPVAGYLNDINLTPFDDTWVLGTDYRDRCVGSLGAKGRKGDVKASRA